jgi:YVTN family beta-propeller protein
MNYLTSSSLRSPLTTTTSSGSFPFRVVSSITTGEGPFSIAYDSNNSNIYATIVCCVSSSSSLGMVSVINTTTNTAVENITVGSNPQQIAYDPSNGNLYVADWGNAEVTVIDGNTNSVIANITVGVHPYGVAVDLSNYLVYVTTWNYPNINGVYGQGSVFAIDPTTNSVVANITAGSWSHGIAYDPSNGYLYVTNWGNNGDVTLVNGATNGVIGTIPFPSLPGSQPEGLTYVASKGYMYVANSQYSLISVINATSNNVISNITDVGNIPENGVYNGANDDLYITNYGSNVVTIVNTQTDTVITNLSVGPVPFGIAFDPTNGLVYEANSYSNSVFAIS